MNIDDLTLGQIKQIQNLMGKKEESQGREDHGICIVILQRGWVYVGHKYQLGDRCWLEDASNIRQWGTTKGLGELAEGGPTSSTKLDQCYKPVLYHELAEINSIECEKSKWPNIK